MRDSSCPIRWSSARCRRASGRARCPTASTFTLPAAACASARRSTRRSPRCRRRSGPRCDLRVDGGRFARGADRRARPFAQLVREVARRRLRRRRPGAPTCASGPRRGSRPSCAARTGSSARHAVDEYVELADVRASRGRRPAGRRALLAARQRRGPARSPAASTCGSGRPSIRRAHQRRRTSRSGMTRCDLAPARPAQRLQLDLGRDPEAGARAGRSAPAVGSRHSTRVPRDDRRGVEVRHRPGAAVDVLAAADAHRLEDAGDRARRRTASATDRLRARPARRRPRACRWRRSHACRRAAARRSARPVGDAPVQVASARSGRRARASSASERTAAPAGREAASASGASGAVACQPTARRPRAAGRRARRRRPAAAARGRVPGAPQRAARRPARAATIEPAEVPTNARQSRT